MGTHTTDPVDLDATLSLLVTVTAEHFDGEPGISAAHLKNLLTVASPTFPEQQRALGFKKFVDLLDVAQEKRLIQVERHGENQHPFISPWDPSASRVPETHDAGESNHRVRGTMWPIVVDWEPSYLRIWDREAGRGFMYPVTADGTPAWEQHPDRFLPIDPVTPDQQFQWMREFANTLPPEAAGTLLPTIGPDAPRGAYRKALLDLNVDRDWTATLQRRVSEHVRAWALHHGIAPSAVLERRRRSDVPARTAALRSSASEAAPERGPVPAAEVLPAAASMTDALRARLHSVIDQMSATELSAIPIPAVYLIQK